MNSQDSFSESGAKFPVSSTGGIKCSLGNASTSGGASGESSQNPIKVS